LTDLGKKKIQFFLNFFSNTLFQRIHSLFSEKVCPALQKNISLFVLFLLMGFWGTVEFFNRREVVFLRQFIIFCLLTLSSAITFAQDADLLKALVDKGILTNQEAIETRKLAAQIDVPVAIAPDVQSFKLWGYTQCRYMYAYQDSQEFIQTQKSISGTALRRLVLIFNGDIDKLTHYLLIWNLAYKRRPLNNITLSRDITALNGSISAGFTSPLFSIEDKESGRHLMALERTIACRYWGGGDWGYKGDYRDTFKSGLCFSGSHVGIFWNGKIDGLENFVYGCAITNSQCDRLEPESGNGLSYWFNIGYKKTDGRDMIWYGINTGFADKLMGVIDSQATPPAPIYGYVSTFGINPFIWFRKGAWTFQSEIYYSYIQNGKTVESRFADYTYQSPYAMPFGAYALLGYRIKLPELAGDLEPVIRFSAVYSDGRGIDPSDTYFGLTSINGLYDKAEAYYIGFNWYFYGQDYLKVQIGYEHLEFRDEPLAINVKSSSADVMIMQLQVIF